MTKSFFKLKNIVDLDSINYDTHIPESDFYHVTKGEKMLQFEYNSTEDYSKIEVKPGLFKIIKTNSGLELDKTNFINDQLLDEYNSTEHIEKVIDCFFKNLDMYKEFGIEIPKRNMLLYGPPGTGKTSSVQKTVNKYLKDGRTVVITWDTYFFDAFEIKEFVSRFNYVDADKIIVIAEDIGGISSEDTRIRSSSSLLRLLDNTDKTFTIPVMIIATTNYVANLSENLTNRFGRFDDKIEVGYPNADNRVSLLKFFSKNTVSEDVIALMRSNSCKKFTVAHIKECYIRSRLHDKNLFDVIKEVSREMEEYEKGFSKQMSIGL
jgi:AAA+ superfamily predicted ATPase